MTPLERVQALTVIVKQGGPDRWRCKQANTWLGKYERELGISMSTTPAAFRLLVRKLMVAYDVSVYEVLMGNDD